ncbi:hypothetical protein L873DRAFT_1791442 [Choiromyces venosus 120613-1]|uniref:Tudor domain-containing protein n=1 Tax=Choiromyces venosus 120613-1 TaxID=1336337 RepID=A0A3N4JEE1_9PEZI|nr:hypothetical protein L873DRAFT_1791442 [Choiromyces venosus 120613-1]
MEAELKEYKLQLESVEAALKADPENPELVGLVTELKEVIALTESVLAEQAGRAPSPPPPSHHRNYTNHNNKRDAPSASNEVGGTGTGSNSVYAVGDNVLARWTSGDNQLYPARITSVMGSQQNPVYIVKFTQYNATETLHAQHIKPASNFASKKRKLDSSPIHSNGNSIGPSSASSTPTTSAISNSAIISQPATINAELAEASKRESSKTADGPSKVPKTGRKIAQKKVLEEGKKKWQDFASKGVKGKTGKAKKIGESSMFRTPEGVHGRVGFTGSGQPMRKDVARGKHVYHQGEEEE